MAARQCLDAVQPPFPAAQGGLGVGLHDPVYVMLIHFLGDAAVESFPHGRRPDRREPVAGIRVAAAAEMCDLAHQRRAQVMHTRAELLKMRDDGVRADVELPEDVGRIAIHVGGAAEHGQRETAACLFLVIQLIGFAWHAADLEPAGMARAHDAVAQLQLPDREWLKQRILDAVCCLCLVHFPLRPIGNEFPLRGRAARALHADQLCCLCSRTLRTASSSGAREPGSGTASFSGRSPA